MRFGKLFAGCAVVGLLSAGCVSQQKYTPVDPAKVTVRFFAPSPDEAYAQIQTDCQVRLASDNPMKHCKGGMETSFESPVTDSQHVVLWGGEFNGNNVSQAAVPLTAGPYMFTAFDPDNGSAYQGWIAVNNGGDDLASALADWRETVKAEQEWLAFECKLDGKYSSRDPRDFNDFTRQLRTLKSLEAKIDRAAKAESYVQYKRYQEQVSVLNGAQVLLMPGESNPFTPCTAPAFDTSELSQARSGQPVTKVVLAGDYARTMEKLRRVSEMQGDLRRSRAVFSEQVRRLENRAQYYKMTDHIYNHGNRFLANEQRIQNAHGQIERIDNQLAANGRRENALLFIAGLFDADEAFKAFDRQQAALERERVVLDAQKCRLDRMFDGLDESSERRIAVERQRQNVVAELQQLSTQQQDTEQSRWAVAQLRQSTNVIHRQGPASVLATSFAPGGMPAKVWDAISRESMMTIRLQAAGSEWAHPGTTTESSKNYEFELISYPNN